MAWNLGLLGAAGSSGAGAYDLLETFESTGSANSVTFTGLDTYTDYKHLQIRGTYRYQNSTSFLQSLHLLFNGTNLSTNDYARHMLKGDGSSVTSESKASTNRIDLKHSLMGNGEVSGAFSSIILDVFDFSSNSKKTTARALAGAVTDDTGSQQTTIALYSGLFNSTAAITSLELTTLNNNYVTGTRFSLYGLKG